MSQVVSNYRIEVNAKPEDVFAYISDLTKHGEWSENEIGRVIVDRVPVLVRGASGL